MVTGTGMVYTGSSVHNDVTNCSALSDYSVYRNSMEYYNVLCELLNGHKLIEFDFIIQPYDTNDNTDSSIQLYCNGHIVLANSVNLALTYDCATRLYTYCQYQYHSNQMIHSIDRINRLNYTKCLLLINSDHSTYHNYRCRYINTQLHNSVGLVSILFAELQYNQLLLSKHYKSGETWAYRRYIIKIQLQYITTPAELHSFMNTEVYVCDVASTRHPYNYYSWSHRLWLYNTVVRYYQHSHHRLIQILLLNELHDSKQFNNTNFNEYNALHYRLQLCELYCINYTQHNQQLFHWVNRLHCITSNTIPSLASITDTNDTDIDTALHRLASADTDSEHNVCTGCQLIQHELQYIRSLLQQYATHESLWYCLRQLSMYCMVLNYQHQYHSRDTPHGSIVPLFNDTTIDCMYTLIEYSDNIVNDQHHNNNSSTNKLILRCQQSYKLYLMISYNRLQQQSLSPFNNNKMNLMTMMKLSSTDIHHTIDQLKQQQYNMDNHIDVWDDIRTILI